MDCIIQIFVQYKVRCANLRAFYVYFQIQVLRGICSSFEVLRGLLISFQLRFKHLHIADKMNIQNTD